MVKEKKDKSHPENMKVETELWNEGYNFIAGIDDVGRGCFAGPVVCAAVIMPKDFKIQRLTDSKLISKKELPLFESLIKENALAWGVGEVDVETIDEINIKNASRLAMRKAVEEIINNFGIRPDFLLVDGDEVVTFDNIIINQESIHQGDFLCHGISAASVIAKVYRDDLMKRLDEKYGNIYGWEKNAGYPTKAHKDAVLQHGITPYHRKTWKTMEIIDTTKIDELAKEFETN